MSPLLISHSIVIYGSFIFRDLRTADKAENDKLEKLIEVTDSPYKATDNAHAIVICTEWDEFLVCLFDNHN